MVRAQTRGFLPDVRVYDPSAAGGYPNGRRLTDDVVDPMIAIVTMGRLNTDGVGPHADLLDEFPISARPRRPGLIVARTICRP